MWREAPVRTRKRKQIDSCKDAGGGVTTLANDVTYGPDWYITVSKGKSATGPISQKTSAKRIGECKK